MTTTKLIVLLILSTPHIALAAVGCIGNDTEACRWETADYVLQVSAVTLQTVDWMQTRNALLHAPELCESNPILGRHPSRARLNLTVLGAIAGQTFIAMLLPRPYRGVWQSVIVTAEVTAVGRNIGIRGGFKLSFP